MHIFVLYTILPCPPGSESITCPNQRTAWDFGDLNPLWGVVVYLELGHKKLIFPSVWARYFVCTIKANNPQYEQIGESISNTIFARRATERPSTPHISGATASSSHPPLLVSIHYSLTKQNMNPQSLGRTFESSLKWTAILTLPRMRMPQGRGRIRTHSLSHWART